METKASGMDAAAAPVVRGEFLYRDALLVDVGGEGKRPPRAPESELKALLNGKAPKDQVAHFYEAQLIHYGLQRSKEKNTAKVRLQQALGQGKLKAPPPHIVDMEGQMKKDYASAVRKAKAASKSSAGKDDKGAVTKATKKRKNDEVENESSKRTKISMNVGGISINIEQDEQQSSKKRQAASKTSMNHGNSKSTKGGKTANASPQKPSCDQKTKTTKKSARETSDTPAKPATSKAKPKADTAAISSTPSKSTESKAKAAPKAKAEPKVKAEPKKSNAKTKAEPDFKQEAKVKAEPQAKKRAKVTSTIQGQEGSKHQRRAHGRRATTPAQRHRRLHPHQPTARRTVPRTRRQPPPLPLRRRRHDLGRLPTRHQDRGPTHRRHRGGLADVVWLAREGR